MGRKTTARWQTWSGDGIQHLVLTEEPDGIAAEAVVIDAVEGLGFAARFRIACDPGWRVRRVEAGVVGDDRRVELASDGAGRW